MSEDRVDIELLLQHRAFVRSLARRLVRDEARAEDVVQDTYVTALLNPPRHAGALRAWLATVVRKLAWTHTRSEMRRAARERKAVTPAPAPTPAEVLERATWHRKLVNLVMELDEPYRTTLLLRYFEDLNSSEIAAQQGVPAATVRTRLRRGLEQLRERLDKDTPGGRERWLAGLVMLGWPGAREAAAAAAGGSTAARVPRWPVAAAAVGLVAVAVLLVQFRSSGRETVPRSPSATRPAPAPSDLAGHPPPPEQRVRAEPDAGVGELLDVTVLADGRPAAGARIVLAARAGHPWRYSEMDHWRACGRGRADAAGCAHFEGVPHGYVRVLAMLPDHARGETFAYLPQDLVHPVVVELRRTPPLEVVVRDGAGPVAGATVDLVERNGDPWWPRVLAAPTDASGRTIVDGVDGSARVVVRAPGYAPSGPRVPPESGSLEVPLEPRTRTVKWPLASVAGQPAPGTLLSVRRLGGATRREARVVGRDVVLTQLEPGIVPELLAMAPDGTFARLQADRDESVGPAVAFAAPPRLAVTVSDSDGKPLTGIEVRLADAATGNPVYPGGVTRDGRVTGPDGRDTLPVYARDPVRVELYEDGHPRRDAVKRYDPATGDGSLAFELPRARPVRLRVEPELPDEWELYVGRRRIEPAPAGPSELRFVVRAREPVHVYLLAPGFVTATRIVDPRPRGPVELAIRLEPAGSLELKVVRATAGQPFALELVDAEPGAAPPRRGPWTLRLYPGPDHVVRETMLPPGRFRVRDRTSGAMTPEFTIPPGGAAVRLRLDLTGVGRPERISGRVVAPGGLVLRGTEVVAVEQGGDARRDVVSVARDGTFFLPWRGVAPLRVFARHPRVGDGPAVTVTRPRHDLTLPLELRRYAQLRLVPTPPVPPVGVTPPRVHLDRPPYVLDALLDGDTLRFAGYEAGEARLWIDLPGFAPAQLPAVQLPDARVDLGTLELSRGASLRFRVLVPSGEAPPALTISAQALAAPRYQRSCRSAPGAPLVLGGLGPGAFRVTAWDQATGARLWSREIETDGETATEVVIDLR